MDILKQAVELHLLLWLVPIGSGIVLAAFGAGLSRRWMTGVALGGLVLPLIQAFAAESFFLWGPPFGVENRVVLGFLSGDRFFGLAFRLNATGGWAILLTATLALAAQLHALPAVACFAGRHRYHALVLVLSGAAAFLFSADSPAAFLIGWEGLSLAGAFLYAFWESEERGARPGMRWLLFQRASGLLLLLGLLAIPHHPRLGPLFLLVAALIRAGQIPFHGWVPGSTRGAASTTALVHGIGSGLSAVYLLDRFWLLIAGVEQLPEVIGVVAVSGIVLGIAAGLQQHDPEKALGWLLMFQTALALMGFAVGDPAAAKVLVTGQVLVLGGAVLAVGGGPAPAIGFTGKEADSPPRARLIMVILAMVWAFPPSISFMGLSRLMGSVPSGTLGLLLGVAVCLAAVGMGWTFQWLSRTQPSRGLAGSDSSTRMTGVASLGLWGVAFALGVAGIVLTGRFGVGDLRGLVWGIGVSGCTTLGWILRKMIARPRPLRFFGRLTATQRLMDRLAGTGLGIGEFIVQLPLMIVRALGVVFWRGIGDFVVDTLLLGSAVRTVEGVGIVLRFIQNGRIQRYTLVVVGAALLLILIMLR